MNLREEASIQFSGGSDSTLSAAIAAEKFDHVHLITFTHKYISETEKSEVQVANLKRCYGEDKFIRYHGNTDQLMGSIYFDKYFSGIISFGTHMAAFPCVACKMAMDVATIVYNLKTGVRYIYDGQQREKEMWPMQMEAIIDLMKDFFAEYGIVYDCPSYDVKRTDKVLFEKGITKESDVKFRAILKKSPSESMEFSSEHSHQPSCCGGVIGNIVLVGYFIPIWGQKRHEMRSVKYYKQKLGLLRSLIDRQLQEEDKTGPV